MRLWLVCGLLGLLCAGCPSGNGAEPEPVPSPDPMEDDGSIRLTSWDSDGEWDDVTDDAVVPVVAGFQGGYMLRPMLRLPEDGPYAEDDAFVVTVRHKPHPDDTEPFYVAGVYQTQRLEAFAYRMNWSEVEPGLVIGPLDDLLSDEPLDDKDLLLEVQVQNVDVNMTLVRQVHLVGEMFFDSPCLAFTDNAGDSCPVAVVPQTFTVDRLTPTTHAACADAVAVTATPARDYHPHDCSQDVGADVDVGAMWSQQDWPDVFSAGCLATAGVDVGSSVDVDIALSWWSDCAAPAPRTRYSVDVDACVCR